MTEIPIPLSAMTLTRCTLPDVRDEPEHKEHTFLVQVPTQLMRERLHLRLFELGAVQVSAETLRACQVNELFEIFPDDQAEQLSDFLGHFWEADDIHTERLTFWQQREAQRLVDEATGGVKRPAEEMPKPGYTFRERYKAQAIIDDVNQRSPRARKLLAQRADWSRQQVAMTTRIAVKGVDDGTLELEMVDAGDGGEILSEDSLETIKVALGMKGWAELAKFINAQYSLSPAEEKNSGSPAGNEPGQTGSAGDKADGDDNSGSSTSKIPTTSSSTPTPTGGSGTTTGKSSRSSSATKGRTKNTGQMAEA